MDLLLIIGGFALVVLAIFVAGVYFHAIVQKDVKDAADEFVKARNSVLAEYQSILARLRGAEQDALAKVEAIKKAL